MKIGITTPVLVGGDAVGNDVMGMGASLQKAGHEVHYFALDSHVNLSVHPISDMERIGLDVYIYHHSINCELGVHFFEKLSCRKIVKYHNITPAHFFTHPQIINECNKGREQLHTIVKQKCEVWADSIYNGEEMRQIKDDLKYTVIPPYNQVDILYETTPDLAGVLQYDDWNANIMMVGRVAPNKDIILGIEAFQALSRRRQNSRMLIVGDAGGAYAEQVRWKIKEMGLQNKIILLGKVPVTFLRALYLIADVLLITSKHEGFCVPMVEAMAFNVPVVANKLCALPYTGGDAVHYTDEKNPSDIAAGIDVALENRIHFIELGQRRFDALYANRVVEAALLSAINSK
jgi:glycosyltransferase involved in cell wall biosynthesis